MLRYILVITVLFANFALAQQNKVIVEDPPKKPIVKAIDKTQMKISDNFTDLALSLDRFFGDEQVDAETQTSQLRLITSAGFLEHEDPDYDINIRARISLPRTQHKFKLLIEDLNNKESSDTTSLQKDEDNDVGAGLMMAVDTPENWHVQLDGGIKLRLPLDPFFRFRVRNTVPLGEWDFRWVQTFFWFNSNGLGENTLTDFDFDLSDNVVFRIRNEAEWTQENNYFEFYHGLIFLQRIDDVQAFSYQTAAQGISEPTNHVVNYLVAATSRRRIYSDWLFFEITPSLQFPRKRDFKLTPGIAFKLESFFGSLPGS